MKTEMRYRVMEDFGEGWEVHTEDLEQEEACVLAESLSKTFPNSVWWIDLYEHIVEEERHYNEYAVDGWEDMYPNRDY